MIEENVSRVPELLRRYGLRPDRRLGQNFLIDTAALLRVVEAGNVDIDDTVLEIGPGLGSLTCLLARRARRVIAVEIDRDIVPPLKEVLLPYPNVILVEGDILQLDIGQLFEAGFGSTLRQAQPSEGLFKVDAHYLVVANIPYYITSAVFRHLLEANVRPKRMVLTVQREVAERICAGPGEMSLLALSVQVYGEPRVMARIPAGAFYPPPKVESAIVRVDLYPEPLIPFASLATFFHLAKAAFSQKRKTLRNALSAGMGWSPARVESLLQAADINSQRRAETVSLAEWGRLTALYSQTE